VTGAVPVRQLEGAPFALGGIPAEGLFLPGMNPEATEQLLQELWRQRQASFLAGGLTLSQISPTQAQSTGFVAAYEAYQRQTIPWRRALMESPCMRIWLRRMRQLPQPAHLEEKHFAMLEGLLSDGARLLNAEPTLTLDIKRFEVDPLLAAFIPPSYVFDDVEAKRRREPMNPYSLVFAEQVIHAALARIGEIWPSAQQDFSRFVKMVIHLPDLESRSCSAARFAGAILLSSGDATLLAVEESLVHECGHQILYCVMEADPLIQDDGRRSFTLPWSGAQRDAYGYFHATYIYLILAMFFERAVAEGGHEASEALPRLRAVLAGLERAIVDFADADFFTPTGQVFFDRMAHSAGSVIARNRRSAQCMEELHG
jgi:hypothetical protein